MKALTLSARGLTETANQCKEVFLESMVDEKMITQGKADEMNSYAIVIIEKGFFGKFWDRVHFNWNDTSKDQDFKIAVVKITSQDSIDE